MNQEDENLKNFSLTNVKQHNRDVFSQEPFGMINNQFNISEDSRMIKQDNNILQEINDESSNSRNDLSKSGGTLNKSKKIKKSDMRPLDKGTEEDIYNNLHGRQSGIIVNEQEQDPENMIQPFAGAEEQEEQVSPVKTPKDPLPKEPIVNFELLKYFNDGEEIEDLFPHNEFQDNDQDYNSLGVVTPEASFLGGQSDIVNASKSQNSTLAQGSQKPLNKRSSGATSIVYSAQFQQSQDHMKKAISDSYFDGEDLQQELTETIMKVYEHQQKLSKDKLETLKIFEKKLKKFIFDYRYDSHMQPRKYYSVIGSEQNLKQKFRDEKYDQRHITYTIAGPEVNPFALLSNELDVYVDILSNEPCIKMACYQELQEYFSAIFQDEVDILSNFQTEKWIYHQCLSVTFKENKLTLKIRVQPKESNLFKSRDLIINEFHKKQKDNELDIFSSFVLYWAQKKKLISTDCIDKNAWITLILHFFQINKRIPPAINYDVQCYIARTLEDQCYLSMEQKYQEIIQNKDKSNLQNSRTSIPRSIAQEAGPQIRQRRNMFDFELFKAKQSSGNFVLLSQGMRQRRRVAGEEDFQNTKNNFNSLLSDSARPYQILPLSMPQSHDEFDKQHLPTIDYGQFFYKFIYYLHRYLIASPTAITLSGKLIWKKTNPNNNIIIEPIAIMDFVSTNVNLVAHLSYSPDAFKHITDQIELVYETIQKKKNAKVYLSEIQKPYFARK